MNHQTSKLDDTNSFVSGPTLVIALHTQHRGCWNASSGQLFHELMMVRVSDELRLVIINKFDPAYGDLNLIVRRLYFSLTVKILIDPQCDCPSVEELAA